MPENNSTKTNNSIKYILGILGAISTFLIGLKLDWQNEPVHTIGSILVLLFIWIILISIYSIIREQGLIFKIIGYLIILTFFIFAISIIHKDNRIYCSFLYKLIDDEDKDMCCRNFASIMSECGEQSDCSTFTINAENFIEPLSNVCNNCLGYGDGIITDRYSEGEHSAVYDVNFECEGLYTLEILFTSNDSLRNVEISLEDSIVNPKALGTDTGGWRNNTLSWENCGELNVRKKGINRLMLYTVSHFPHIRKLRFSSVKEE